MPARRQVLVVVLALASACAKKAAPDSATPASESAAPQSIEDLEAELDRQEGELRRMGLAREGSGESFDAEGSNKTPAADDATNLEAEDRCTRICDLAAAIRGLQDQICDLAAEHDDDERYAASCNRAQQDSDTATEACDACRG